MMTLEEMIENIQPLNQEIMAQAKQIWDNLAKPIGSFGRLEDMAIQISGIRQQVYPSVSRKALVIMCADNGVYDEGVSMADQSVTAAQTLNFFAGTTGAAVLAKKNGIDLKVVDIGIKEEISHPDLIRKKIAKGTKNAAKGPSMTKEEARLAVSIGFQLMKSLKEQGYDMVGTGEMGISNTTTACAVIHTICQCPLEKAVGKGAGLTEELYLKKVHVIEKMLSVNSPDRNDPFDVLAKVGGFDIGGLVGCFLGGAYYRIPVVIDGVISMAAALLAYMLAPLTKAYMLPSHASAEGAYGIAAAYMGIKPYFDLQMRLGEGSGCPFTMYLAQCAMDLMNHMATFQQANVDKSKYIDIRSNEK